MSQSTAHFEISQVAKLVCLPDCDSLEDQKLKPINGEKETRQEYWVQGRENTGDEKK